MNQAEAIITNQTAMFGILVILAILAALLVLLTAIITWAYLSQKELIPKLPAIFNPRSSNLKSVKEEDLKPKLEIVETSDPKMVPNKPKDDKRPVK